MAITLLARLFVSILFPALHLLPKALDLVEMGTAYSGIQKTVLVCIMAWLARHLPLQSRLMMHIETDVLLEGKNGMSSCLAHLLLMLLITMLALLKLIMAMARTWQLLLHSSRV